MSAVTLTFADKIRLLMRTKLDVNGEPYSAAALAACLGFSDQTVLNLLNSDGENPRLHTLRRLANFYGVPLDYFMCGTLEECSTFLIAAHPDRVSPILQAIHDETERLSSKGKRNTLKLMEWVEWVRKRGMS